MRKVIRVGFAHFWPGFTPETFKSCFPFLYDEYDLVVSPQPEIVFYSLYTPEVPAYPDPRHHVPFVYKPGNYLRVFITGENFEPDMESCEFAMTFSVLVNHPNHLRLPLWVFENRGWGYGPERLIKTPNVDWEKVAREKTHFCSFVHMHEVAYRDQIFKQLNAYKRVDSAGAHLNNLNGWTVPMSPNRVAAKVEFFRRYKFTLAVENIIWPGYTTEKLVDPMYASSIPIYVGDPQAHRYFDPASYIDFARFSSMNEMMEFVREVDNNPALYLKMLAAPYYRNNTIPDHARTSNILPFFERIFEAAIARRTLAPQFFPHSNVISKGP